MEFAKTTDTKKKTAWTNTCQYIIVHHTAGGTFESNMNLLSIGERQASVHYVVGAGGEIGKIGNHKDILWHAGESARKGRRDINRYSIGIEVVSDGYAYTDIQRTKTKELIEYIMKEEGIPQDCVLRHADLTHIDSINWVLRNGKSKSRKWDIGENFYKTQFSSWVEYQKSLLLSQDDNMLDKQLISALILINSVVRNMLDAWNSATSKSLRDKLWSINEDLRKLV